jgi:hypothetical protein
MVAVRRLMAAMVGVGVFATGAAAQDAVQWRVEDGGNGHWYGLDPTALAWTAAQEAAVARGGHLATTTSEAEHDFIQSLKPAGWHWLGGRLACIDGLPPNDDNCEWIWVTGEAFEFSAWSGGEPNYVFATERTATNGGAWFDMCSPCDVQNFTPPSIIEWSADCNNDGLVDYGQILSGELADANANGVPDTCESTIIVPTQFPTIQAAIDSVPSGVAKTISVLAGTYNQSFALNGKNVVVRGAPNNATILDGTGLATSIVRFSGGEPVAAGIENLVLRNGTVGSLIFPKAPFRVGGGLYASNSAAFVRNCRFESNESDFGGGACLYRSMAVVDGCEFVGNNASAESGGLHLFESSGTVSDTLFSGNTAALVGTGAASAFKAVGAGGPGGIVALTGCTIESNAGNSGSTAVEMFENFGPVRGTLVVSSTVISGNVGGGIRVIGTPQGCVLADGTVVCGNSPRNVVGPFLIEGKVEVCDCLADTTLDGAVNGADLGVVLAAWGSVSSSGSGDVNHDGLVDGADLAQVLASWGACP